MELEQFYRRKILNGTFYKVKSHFIITSSCIYLQLIMIIRVSGLRIRLANLFFKLLTCFLYIFRVITDNDPTYAAW